MHTNTEASTSSVSGLRAGLSGVTCMKRWFYTKGSRTLYWNHIVEREGGGRERGFIFLQIVGALFGIEMRGFVEQSLEEELWEHYLKNWGNFWTFTTITPMAQPLSSSCMKPQQSVPWIATHYGNASSVWFLKMLLLHHSSHYPTVPGELCLVILIVFLLAGYMMKHLLISSEDPLEHLY